MKALLFVAATIAASASAFIFLRAAVRYGFAGDALTAEETWTPDGGFPLVHLVVVVPVVAFSLAALAILGNTPTNEGQVIGLLLTSSVMAAALPKLSGELVLWAHRATRLSPDREADIIARIRRAGSLANEVWVSPGPTVLCWRANLLSPALAAGSRVMVNADALDLAPSRTSGIALAAHKVRSWPWALWPIAVALELRFRFQTIVPWWMFVIPTVAIGWSVAADLAEHLRIRSRLRTDAAAADSIGGMLDLIQIEARMVSDRANGRMGRRLAKRTIERGRHRAARFGSLAGISEPQLAMMTAALTSLDRSIEDTQTSRTS